VVLDRVEDLCRAASTELARGRGAQLQKVGGDGLPVVHCVESSDLKDERSGGSSPDARPLTHLVHSHLGHVEELGDGVHDAYAGPPVILSLSEVEEGHASALLVLLGVSRDDLLGSLHVLLVELERDLGLGIG
jgi:hypothetical protein